MNNFFKRKLISKKECLHDLESELQTMFRAFSEATQLYEQEIVSTPPVSRAKNFEASFLNSKMMQCIQKYFPVNWKFGKYKRFILRINGYNVLFKKLNGKDMPMNVKTVLSDAITNQLQYSLFNDSPEVADPIVFFGYRKDKFGNITSPKLVYIDENHVKWVIDSADIKAQNIVPITQNNSEGLLKIKKRDSEEKMAN